MRFVHSSVFEAPAQRVFAFHEAPDAFELLQPPWQKTEVLQPPRSLEVGTVVCLKVKVGPFWQTIEAEHIAYEPGRSFTDRMNRGPFRQWVHHHLVEPVAEGRSRLTDDVTYELPLGPLGQFFGGWFARRQLKRLFRYRHEVTRVWSEGER